MQIIDLEEFKYGGTNITAFRLVDPDNLAVQHSIHDWIQAEHKAGIKHPQFQNSSVVKAETALMYDAVHLFAKALHDLDTSQQIDIQPLSCDGEDTWPHGYSLINYMKIVSTLLYFPFLFASLHFSFFFFFIAIFFHNDSRV